MTQQWQLERGATVLPEARGGGVRFAVWAPNARRVRVRLTSAGTHEHELEPRGDSGVFEGTVADIGAGVDYGFVLDDREQLLPDPVSRWQPEGVHGASRVVDPAAFVWTDRGSRGIAMADLVIYELHVGAFTTEGTFDAAIPYLRGLRRELGVTAIEIMPVAQFPGSRNWGYDGVELYAVQNSYGGTDGLKRLVNAAHAEGLAVILDVVYNHVGPEGNYLPLYGPYFTEKYKTPWGPALNYDDAHSDEVRRYIVDNALYWVTEYHVDGLRLDAVHGIFDFSATHLLQDIARSVHAQGEALGRRILVIGESDLNDPKLIRPVNEHGYGLDGQWADDFHHAVHAALTRETAGYYCDFGDVETIAESLREPFVFDGGYSSHRKRRHGASSVGIPRDRFVVAIQNHDQVGNRATGDRLSTLLGPDQLRLAAALLLLSPYVPLIFMGEEYGETNSFQYFVSHGDPQLVDAVRAGRRREFESFGWADEVPDPQSEETLRSSTLDREKAAQPGHAQLFALYRDLLALRDEEPLLRPGAAEIAVDHAEGCIALLRTARDGGSQALLALFNCSADVREAPIPEQAHGPWTLRLRVAGSGLRVAGSGSRGAGSDERGAWSVEQETWRGERGAADEPRRLMDATATELQPTQRSVTMAPWSAAVFQRPIP